MKIKNILTIIGLMSLIVSGIPNLGMATTITTTYLGGAYGYDSGSINPGPGGVLTNNVGFGGDSQMLATATAPVNFATVNSNFVSWCVDVYHWDSTNSTYTVGTAADLASSSNDGNPASAFGTNRVNALIKLANEDYSLVKDKITSAQFQLAVWAIMFGTPTNGIYQVNSSSFTATDPTDTAAITNADTWLTNLNNNNYTGYYQLTYLSDDYLDGENTQDMVVFTPVPEPSTLFLLGVGIAGVAFYGKRRKNSKAI